MKSQITTLLMVWLTTVYLIGQNINVTPAQINFNLEPGETTATDIVIKNTGDSPLKVNISLGDWTMKPNGDATYHVANSTDNSCSKWIILSTNLIELNPNESKKVKVTMKIPAGSVQTSWSVIYINEADEQVALAAVDKSLKVGAEIVTRVGIPVYQSPRKSGTYKAAVKNLKEIKGANNKRQFSVDLSNLGDKVIKGKVFITLSNIQTAEEVETPIHKLTILPDLTRTLIFTLPASIPKGVYSMSAILDYHSEADLEGSQLKIEVK